MQKSAIVTIIVIIAFVGFGIFLMGVDGPGGTSDNGGREVEGLSADDWVTGNAASDVVLIEYGDFQCPACGVFHPIVSQLKQEFGDRVAFVYRHFPLRSIHPNAEPAARATEAAGMQGKFWEMHDKIFENQEQLSIESLKIWAIQIGLNSIQFGNCLDSAKYFAEVEQDLQAGIAAGVRATPTFFVNGQRIEGAIPFTTFEQIILSELSR